MEQSQQALRLDADLSSADVQHPNVACHGRHGPCPESSPIRGTQKANSLSAAPSYQCSTSNADCTGDIDGTGTRRRHSDSRASSAAQRLGGGLRIDFSSPDSSGQALSGGASGSAPCITSSMSGATAARGSGGAGLDTMVRKMFNFADKDGDGFICSAEYRAMLQALGVWELTERYTETRWGLTWAQICQHLGCSCERGVSESGLARRYQSCPSLLEQHLTQANAAALVSASLSRLSTCSTTKGAGVNWYFDIPSVRAEDPPSWLVENAASSQVNGVYMPATLPSYSGVQPYLRSAGSRGASSTGDGDWTTWMLRWARRHWALTDVGPEYDFANNKRWIYSVDCPLDTPAADFPPPDGWTPSNACPATLCKDGAPRVRMLECNAGFRCHLSIFGAVEEVLDELTAIQKQLEGQDNGQLQQRLYAVQAAAAGCAAECQVACISVSPTGQIGRRSGGEFWGTWSLRVDAESLVDEQQIEGYFDGFCPLCIFGNADRGVLGEQLRGHFRRQQQHPPLDTTILCEREGNTAGGSAGYRVTLSRLEVCDLNPKSVAYRNGLREYHRVTHVDGAKVNNFEDYRSRAHGRVKFTLRVAVRSELVSHHLSEKFDAGAFAVEWRQASAACWGVDAECARSSTTDAGQWHALRCTSLPDEDCSAIDQTGISV